MSKKISRIGTIMAMSTFALALISPVILTSQGQLAYLTVSGHSGNVPVTQFNGKNYVEIEALARVANGSLSFNGNHVALSLPSGGENAATTAEAAPVIKTGFSKEFLRAGIESLSTIREWHSALASAIENQFPVGQAWLAPYQALATTNLRLAQVAANTDSDRNAAQLIANVLTR